MYQMNAIDNVEKSRGRADGWYTWRVQSDKVVVPISHHSLYRRQTDSRDERVDVTSVSRSSGRHGDLSMHAEQ